MKNKDYTEVICGNFCSFYKVGKEDLHCGAYLFLRDNFTAQEIELLSKFAGGVDKSAPQSFLRDDEIRELICNSCDFLIDGCDFRDNRSGPPCGGYTLVERLL